MFEKIRQTLTEKIHRWTGEEGLRSADILLKEAFSESESMSAGNKIQRARKTLRDTAKKMHIRFIVSCVLLAAALLLAVLLIISLTGKGRNSREYGSAGGTLTSGQGQAEGTAQGNPEGEEESLTEAQTETEPASEKPDVLDGPADILMSFTGDFILGTDEYFAWDTGFNAYYEMYGPDYFLKNVRSVFKKDDLTVINMEGTLTEETDRAYQQFAFKGDPEFVRILTSSSIEAANVANNHSHDYGDKSFEDTVNLLESNRIRTFGYDKTAMLTVKGVNIGFLGIYELDDHLDRKEQLLANIASLKEQGADLIVAVFHWGNELERVPDDNQRILAHLAIDEGADLVIGHHPHVLQGLETYKGKTIAYSLGNFCYGGSNNPTEMDTIIFQQKFTLNRKKDITETETTVIPCSVSSEIMYNDYQPRILEGEEAERVLELVEERSSAIPEWTGEDSLD